MQLLKGRAMKVHERTPAVTKVRLEISEFICKLMEREPLTHVELNQVLLEEAISWNKFALREERHPDRRDKGAAEA